MFLEKVHEGFQVPCPACGHTFMVPPGSTDEPPPPPPPPHGQAPSPFGNVPAPKKPGGDDGTLLLVIGIVAIVLCQLLGPVAWYMGHQARSAARARGEEPSSQVTTGWVLGIVSTILLLVTGCIVGAIFVAAAAGKM
jgi:hypothetical protein